MLKMYTTQLRGVFDAIQNGNEDVFEDGGRMIAQTLISDGRVFIQGFDELKAVMVEATVGPNALKTAVPLEGNGGQHKLSTMDLAIIFTRTGNDPKACEVVQSIKSYGATVIGVSSLLKDVPNPFADIVDLHLNLHANRPLIPLNDDKKIGLPSTIAALFTYHALYFTASEIMDEQ